MAFVQASRRRKWISLVLVSLLLSLTACSNATPTPVPAAADPTLPPTQPIVAKTVESTQPQTTVSPNLTPTITPTTVSTSTCQPSDLTIKPSWSINDDQRQLNTVIKAEVSFTNNSSQTCSLAPISKGQIIDSQGQPVTTSLFFQNFRVNVMSGGSNNPPTQLPPKQTRTLFVIINAIDKCGTVVKQVGQGEPAFKVQLMFGTSAAFDIPGMKIEQVAQAKEHIFDCIENVNISPLEETPGTFFTAQAKSQRATDIAYITTEDARQAATETATPPTPTPTAIPTIVPGSKPCRAEDLSIKFIDENGGGGIQFGALLLINNSSIVCTLKGFPVLQLVDSAGNVIPGYQYDKYAYAITPDDANGKTIPLTPVDAIAPLISLPPNHAAEVQERISVCYSKNLVPGVEGKLELILPDNGGKIELGSTPECKYPEVGVNYFDYAPGDWQNEYELGK